MAKERKINRVLSLMLLCCGAVCLLQCKEKSRLKIETPLDAALALANSIANDVQSQARVLADVGIRQAEIGDYERSLEVLNSIAKGSFFAIEPTSGYPPAWYQARALSKVAFISARGKQQRVQELLAPALQKAKTIQDLHTQADALYQVVRNAVEAGEVEKAIEIARGMTDTFFQPMALAEIADGLQTPQQFDQLLKTVSDISTPYNKVSALIKLAEQLIRRGKSDQVAPLLEGAYETTLQLERSSTASHLLANLAEQYALAGKKGRAQEIFTESLKKAESIRDLPHKSIELSQLTILLAKVGDFEQALEIANRMEAGDDQDRTLIEVVSSLAWADRQAEALNLAQRIQARDRKGTAIARVVAVYTKQRQFQAAQQLVETIDDEFERSNALQQIAFGYAEATEYERALKLALSISDARTQFYTLQKIALLLTAAGQSEQALKTAQMIRDSLYRAQTMVRIASQYAEAGDTIRAAEIIDLALKEIVLIQNKIDQADLLVETSIPWTKAGIVLTDQRKLVLNKLAEGK